MNRQKTIPILTLPLLLTACQSPQTPSTPPLPTEAQTGSTASAETIAEKVPNLIRSDTTLTIPPENEGFRTYIPTLMFHYIQDIPADSPDQLGYRLSLSPDRLEDFLIFFQENNITTLTFRDIKDIIENHKELPQQSVILTFDDGHLDQYEHAFRLLEKYQMKGVFYIISDKPDQDPAYATREQIREIERHGHEIGSHTITHPDLTTLSHAEMTHQISESKKVIEQNISGSVISFCYPAGKHNQTVIDAVSQHYLFARTTQGGKHISLAQRYALPTVRIFPTTGRNSLRIWFAKTPQN